MLDPYLRHRTIGGRSDSISGYNLRYSAAMESLAAKAPLRSVLLMRFTDYKDEYKKLTYAAHGYLRY